MKRTTPAVGKAMLQGWILGYISAVALVDWAQQSDLLEQPSDPQAILAWMDKHCAENPLDAVSLAAAKLVAATRESRNK